MYFLMKRDPLHRFNCCLKDYWMYTGKSNWIFIIHTISWKQMRYFLICKLIYNIDCFILLLRTPHFIWHFYNNFNSTTFLTSTYFHDIMYLSSFIIIIIINTIGVSIYNISSAIWDKFCGTLIRRYDVRLYNSNEKW